MIAPNLSSTDLPFPWKLHTMLEYAEKLGMREIVSWMPSGNAFKVHNRDVFSKRILPQFFRHSNFKSFQRNLSVYSFTRIWTGPESGSYTHRFFLKNDRTLCQFIARQTKSSTPPPPRRIHPTNNNPEAGMDRHIQAREENENQIARRQPNTITSTSVAAVAALPGSAVLGSSSEESSSPLGQLRKKRKKKRKRLSPVPSPGGGEDKKMPSSSSFQTQKKNKQEESQIDSARTGAITSCGRPPGKGDEYWSKSLSSGISAGGASTTNRFMTLPEHSSLPIPEEVFAQNTDTIKWLYDSGFTNADLWNMLDLGKKQESSNAFDLLPPTTGGVLPNQLSPNSIREICSLLEKINDNPLSLAQNEETTNGMPEELFDQLWKDTLTPDQIWKDTLNPQIWSEDLNLQAAISSTFSFSSSSGEMLSDAADAAMMMFQGQQEGGASSNIPFLQENEDPFA